MKRAEIPLLAAIFLDLLGFGMIIVDIQFRAEDLGASGLVIGLLLASMFVVQLLVSSRWGKLSDRLGRKSVLVACTLISGLGMVAYALATNLWWILLARVLAGLGAANVAVAQAYISDTSDHDSRTAAMGRIGAAISTGLIAGPALAGGLKALHLDGWLGWIAAAASGLGALWIMLAVPHHAPEPSTETPAAGKRIRFDIALLRDIPALRPLLVISVVAWFSLAALEGTFGRLIQRTLGYDQREFGLIFGYESLLGVIVPGVILAWLAKRSGDLVLVRAGYLLQGIGLALTPIAPGLLALFGASTLYAFGQGIANPTVTSLASKMTPPTRQGELFGLMQSARSIGFVIGPILGGQLFDLWPPAPYFFAGGICVLAAILVNAQRRAPVVQAPAP